MNSLAARLGHLQHRRCPPRLPLPVQLPALADPVTLRLRLAALPPQLTRCQTLAPTQLVVNRREIQGVSPCVPPGTRKAVPATSPCPSPSATANPRSHARTGDLPQLAAALVPQPQHRFWHIRRHPPSRHRELLPGKDPLPDLAAATRPTLPI